MTLTLFHRVYNTGVIVLGFCVVLLGVALLFLPGPGIPILWLGLAILAGVFVWARHLSNKLHRQIHVFERAVRGKRK